MERNRKRKLVTLAAVGLISLPTAAYSSADSADDLENVKKDDAFHLGYESENTQTPPFSTGEWHDSAA